MRLREPLYGLLLVFLLSGCGQKGPLYLPDAEPEPGPPEEQQADEDDEDDDDNGPGG